MSRPARQIPASSLVGRGAIVLGLLAIGWFAVSEGIAAQLAPTQPEAALAIAPSNTKALGVTASNAIIEAKAPTDRGEAVSRARRAIERDATEVSAIAALALDAGTRGDAAREARLFDYAQHLSRRDLTTQVYFIETAVAAGNVNAALRHYDIALRTSPAAPAIMFPVLQAALTDPTLRIALAKFLATRPPWGESFLGTVATSGTDFVPVLALLSDLRRFGMVPSPDIENPMLGNLAATHPDLAWRYYASSRRGVDAVQPVNAGFDRSTSDGSPFDWQFITDNGVEATLEKSDDKGVLSFSVPATAAGVVAKQLRVLSSGSYRIDTVAMDIAQSKGSQPYWQVLCIDGRPLGALEIGNAAAAGTRFMGMFSVPADCKAQWLQLVARPTDAISGVSGKIDSVSIQRAASGANVS